MPTLEANQHLAFLDVCSCMWGYLLCRTTWKKHIVHIRETKVVAWKAGIRECVVTTRILLAVWLLGKGMAAVTSCYGIAIADFLAA